MSFTSQKKTAAWALQGWLREAQERTANFYQNGPTSPTTWLLVHGKNFPQNAIPGGEENGEPLYICRGFHDVRHCIHTSQSCALLTDICVYRVAFVSIGMRYV